MLPDIFPVSFGSICLRFHHKVIIAGGETPPLQSLKESFFCFAKFICSGGCNANNYHFNGDIDKPYLVTCEMMKKRVECAMHILAEKKVMQNTEKNS